MINKLVIATCWNNEWQYFYDDAKSRRWNVANAPRLWHFLPSASVGVVIFLRSVTTSGECWHHLMSNEMRVGCVCDKCNFMTLGLYFIIRRNAVLHHHLSVQMANGDEFVFYFRRRDFLGIFIHNMEKQRRLFVAAPDWPFRESISKGFGNRIRRVNVQSFFRTILLRTTAAAFCHLSSDSFGIRQIAAARRWLISRLVRVFASL